MSLLFVVLADPLTNVSQINLAKVNYINEKTYIKKEQLNTLHLKEMIWNTEKNFFASYNHNSSFKDLTLWKFLKDLREETDEWESLKELAKDYTETDIKSFGCIKLLSGGKVLDNFQDAPSDCIHILVQPPPPATEKGKRPLEDSDEGQNSKRTKLANQNIISTARKIMEDILKLDKDESNYSNPKKLFLLPFPYPGQKKPVDRFAINNDGFFTFMGRKGFRNVLNTINEFRSGTGYMKLFVYGTVGYGKSHILSAIACFLTREGKRVVYLPDCRQLAVNPVKYIKSALFLTYENNDAKISEINACEDFYQIIKFCESLEETLYFIVDQMNALDEQDDTGVSLDIKRQIKRELDQMADDHFYIMSFSANNMSMLHLMAKQTNEFRIKFFGGFDEEEMKEWWNKYYSTLPEMDNQQKARIEDMTGKIPLFLSLLLKSSYKNFEDILEHLNQNLNLMIQDPMTEFSEGKSNTVSWDRHVQVMSSFLTNNSPPLGYSDKDYDHRYFYIDNDICYYVCGLVRNCMANYLYEKDKMEVFIDINWIKSFKDNPLVKEFVVEKACIASICKKGITVNKTYFKVDHHKFFASTEDIDFSLSKGPCIFYLPCIWNQKSIDGLLALYKANSLYIAPIKITLDREGHSDSEGAFFSGIWPELKSRIPDNLNVEVIFIWIVCKNGVDEEVEMKVRQLSGRDIEINPDYISVVTGFASVNRDIDRYLSQV